MLEFICNGVLCLETNPNLLQWFKKMLRHCFAAKLCECFVDYRTSPDFPSV